MDDKFHLHIFSLILGESLEVSSNKIIKFPCLSFDVWLGNSRDTKLCTKHDEFPLYSKDFLNYNLHQIGIFDLRAFVEFILNLIDGSSISYVGHSQGGCTILILLSMLPEFNAYINQAHLLTPAAFLGAAKSPLLTLSAEYENLIQVNIAST